MSSNHLLLGLGGTGGKILRSFRKTIYQNFRSTEPKGVNIRYLYVDSSDEMMRHDDPTWKILGQSVQLPKISQLHLSGLNLNSVLDNVGSYPGIAPWIGAREQFRDVLSSANAATVVGGQKRRLGRFLFACQINKFREQLQALVKELETGGTAQVTFHVCVGLAGGTGSGSIIDAISQIRALYPGKSYRVLIYGLLPERNPSANRAVANYHANGYAALLDLNALSVSAWSPHDVSGQTRGRLTLQDPFNCCYLFADENEDHNKVDVDKELPDIVSSFLYQKTVAVNGMTWDSLRRFETFENLDFRPEESPSSRKPERSRLFFAFGIKQIAYPEEEIREYMTYQFARQGALQLQYNRWSDSTGFVDEATNQSFHEYVRAKETQQRWRITDEHLCLSEGILPDEISNRRWKPINQFWTELIPNFKSYVRENFASNERVWLDELSKLCEQAYGQNYRDLGVRKFYETKRNDAKDHAREMRGRIEADLFQEWATGVKSMQDISRLLTALLASLEERLKQIDEKIARSKEAEEAAGVRANANAREWAGVGLVGGLLGKRQSLFDGQGECLTQLYISRTRAEAFDFSKKLTQVLSAELATLASEVSKAASTIAEATKEFTADIEQRCADTGEADMQKQVIRFYQPDTIKDFTRTLVRDKNEQVKQTTEIRNALAALLGDTQSFTAFNARIPKEKFISVLETTCEQNATKAHNTYVAENKDRGRVLGVSIVERLNRDYGGNPEALRNYIINIVSRAKNYLCMNEAEVRRQGPGTKSGGPVSSLTIILPEAPDLAEFREQLRMEFRNAAPGAKEDIASKNKPNEITLVSLTNLFPARFVADVQFLKEKYAQRTSSDPGARFELHLEEDGLGLPDLFLPDIDPKKYLSYLLIAQGLQIVQRLPNPDTGLESFYLMAKDDRGRELDPVDLGRDLSAALDSVDLVRYDSVSSTVDQALAADYLHITKRKELLAAVEAEVGKVKAERKNPLDKVYKLYNQAGLTAESILIPRQ